MNMTSAFGWSLRSRTEMKDIHPDLRKIADLALKLSKVDFIVIDGKRTLEEQKRYFASGASKTMKSRHLHGFAIDFVALVGGKVRWEEAYMRPVADAFKAAAEELSIPIVRGIDWKGAWDSGHIELDKKRYPDP